MPGSPTAKNGDYLRAGFADAILLPRIYRQEGLPIGPTWDEIGRMLSNTVGDDPASVRDHAVILLFSVYGLRSGEVRRLQIEDLDWLRDRIRIVQWIGLAIGALGVAALLWGRLDFRPGSGYQEFSPKYQINDGDEVEIAVNRASKTVHVKYGTAVTN